MTRLFLTKQVKLGLSWLWPAYLLDTIEHLVDPTFCLDQINKSLKKNGYLIITTDNITNFLYIQDMLRKGKSPNVPFVLSSKVYSGDWRPHDRE